MMFGVGDQAFMTPGEAENVGKFAAAVTAYFA